MSPFRNIMIYVFVSCFLLSCVPQGYTRYHIKKFALVTEYPKKNHQLSEIHSKNHIDPLIDDEAIIYFGLEDRGVTYSIEYRWIKPDGTLFSDEKLTMKQSGRFAWYYQTSTRPAIALASYPGKWRVEVFVNGQLARSKHFKVIERNNIISELFEFANKFTYYRIGFQISHPSVSDALDRNLGWDESYGVVVEKTLVNSPAERAGIMRGDIILEVNGNKVYSTQELVDLIQYSPTPDATRIHFFRPSTKNYMTIVAKLERISGDELFNYQGFIKDFNKYKRSPRDFIARHQERINIGRVPMDSQPRTFKKKERITKRPSIEEIEKPVTSSRKTLSGQNQGVVFRAKKNWAVIVGISDYRYKGKGGLTNLVFADDDARAVSGILKQKGWSNSRIKLLINEQATNMNIRIAIESWLTKAGPEDLIFLYWSGHGFPDPEDPDKVYFACYDTDVTIPATGFRMDRVRSALEERKARNVIVMADTCHAGKLITRGEKTISIIPHIEKMRREHDVPKGWIFMVGADSDRKAIEHTSWANGAFTHFLIDALSGKADGFESVGPMDGIVTMGELRAYLNAVMPDETQKVLGVAKRPIIITSSGDPTIWNLSLD